MNTLAWSFIFLGVLVFRFVSKGRGLTDLPGDLGALVTAALTNDKAKMKEVLSASGTADVVNIGVKQGVDAGFAVGTAKYDLGAVKPQLVPIANEVGNKFGLTKVLGVRPAVGYGDAEHAAGNALDFFVPNRETGDAVAAYLIANMSRFGGKYVIWWQRIYYPGSGWKAMPDRGSDNNNHKNHVHFNI